MSEVQYAVVGVLASLYTIQPGDTLFAIATRFGLSVDSILLANPGVKPEALAVGQVIALNSTKPGFVSNLQDISKVLGVSITSLQALNPGIQDLKLGQAIRAPAGPVSTPSAPNAPAGPFPGAVGGTEGGGGYVEYSGPASGFPDPSQWQKYSLLWASNSELMKFHDSPEEIAIIKSSIETVALSSGVDARAILCTIIQESGGNVRVGETRVEVRNPGLMQSHNGVSFDENNPAGSILQMIRDGAEGTASGDGLKQLLDQYGNYYEAFRGYNSGTVNKADLNDPGPATPGYVKDMANRLMGHRWDNM